MAYFCIIRGRVHGVFVFDTLRLFQVTMASPTIIVRRVYVNTTCLETFVVLLYHIHCGHGQEVICRGQITRHRL